MSSLPRIWREDNRWRVNVVDALGEEHDYLSTSFLWVFLMGLAQWSLARASEIPERKKAEGNVIPFPDRRIQAEHRKVMSYEDIDA